MNAYSPLYDPSNPPAGPFDLAVEITVTRRLLDETAGLNIHDDTDMMKAAFSLNTRLRCLLAAIQAERGETQ